MERAIIFNAKQETWDYFCRKFVPNNIQNAALRPGIAKMEYEMAKKADESTDIVWFDDAEYSNQQAIDQAVKMNQ